MWGLTPFDAFAGCCVGISPGASCRIRRNRHIGSGKLVLEATQGKEVIVHEPSIDCKEPHHADHVTGTVQTRLRVLDAVSIEH